MNRWTVMLCVASAVGCTASDKQVDTTTDTGVTEENLGMDVYAVRSALNGEDSVSYSGQTFRHLLVHDLGVWMAGLTGRIDGGALVASPGDVSAELLFYLSFDSSTSGTVAHLVTVDGTPLQQTYGDVSSDKNLFEKLAGNDTVTDHQDWATAFSGWSADGVSSPESLVMHWVETLDAQAVQRAQGKIPLDSFGAPLESVCLTANGQDLCALLETFLLGGIAFSQGADDYLDDDIDGKGLLSDHTQTEDGKSYTPLEHAWDEGFGYFGASRTGPQHSDADVAARVGWDVDGDGWVDLTSELHWGHGLLAARRDVDSGDAPDLTGDAWQGFLSGRRLLAETAGAALTPAQLEELQGHRDEALQAWERVIAASIIAGLEQLIEDTAALGTPEHALADHARHWSETKAHALALQFNPRSPLSAADLSALHDLLGTAPVLDAKESVAAQEALTLGRDRLADAYGL